MSVVQRRYSVGFQLSVSVGGMVLVIVGGLLVYLANRQVSQVAHSLESKAVSLARLEAYEVAPGLEFEDKSSAAEALHGATLDQDVTYGMVLKADGGVLADYPDGKRPPDLKPDPIPAGFKEPITGSYNNMLKVSAPITSVGGTQGTLVLLVNKDSVTSERRDVLSVATAAGLVALLIGFAIALYLGRLMGRRLQTMSLQAEKVARGDLSGGAIQPEALLTGGDEVTDLARTFSNMASSLRTMISDLQTSSSEVEREAGSLLTTVTQQSAVASLQATALNETSATVSEIAQTSKQATDYADSVIKVAQKSEELSTEGKNVVEDSVAAMEKLDDQVKNIALSITELSERSLQIGEIISTVKELAERSNMLALNAGIEAAKAGENGRGFAVVALEMRNLAEQSKQATNQVREILSQIQKGTRAAVKATDEGSTRAQAALSMVQRAGDTILGLAEVIRESSQAARQIANNTRQQTLGVEQIVSAIKELSTAMADTVDGMRKIESVSATLTTVSKRLSELVSHYHM
jgi:methyl-accepting chemotaxis protein